MAAPTGKLHSRLMTIDKSIERLRVVYEQFFMGLDKNEPRSFRKQIRAEIRHLKDDPPNNTAIRFLLAKVDTKFKTYEVYWNRVLREIENGVYDKQIKRLRRKVKDEGLDDEILRGVRTKGELEEAMAQLAVLRKAKEETEGKSSPKKGPPVKQVIDPAIRNAYESFVRARLSTGESLEGVTPDRFQATIAHQIPKVKKRFECEEVEIRVSVKNGKAILNFAPRKKGPPPIPET
jgi:hypothetical protein